MATIDSQGGIYLLADLFGVRPKDIELGATTALETALSSLHPRERLVLDLRYGLKDGRCRTLEELRSALGNVSRERVRQIQRRAFGRLQEPTGCDPLEQWVKPGAQRPRMKVVSPYWRQKTARTARKADGRP